MIPIVTIDTSEEKELTVAHISRNETAADHVMVYGIMQKMIKVCIWVNIYYVSCKVFINPVKAFSNIKKLAALRNAYRGDHKIIKYAKAGNRFFFSFNAPGWPSVAFNRYIKSNLEKINQNDNAILNNVVFGITKKCGYKCEHCFEWNNLNQPEQLSKQDLADIIRRFQKQGVTQFQLTGGEPLNRLDDIIDLLPQFKKYSDFWLYTSGYHLTKEKAIKLKTAGLTGVAISLDHWDAGKHDRFRGKQGAFTWVCQAANNAGNAGLAVCLSLCATTEFTAEENLQRYADVALSLNAAFIQVLEPRAVGHYEGKDVSLNKYQYRDLENFYLELNYDKGFKNYPAVMYHGYYKRRVGCAGSGESSLYVDMDGYAHACPFCRRQAFHVLKDDLSSSIRNMRSVGCGAIKCN